MKLSPSDVMSLKDENADKWKNFTYEADGVEFDTQMETNA